MTLTWQTVLLVAAVVLFAVAAAIAFGAFSATSAMALAFVGLACLTASHLR